MKNRILFAIIALLMSISAMAGDIKRPNSYNYQRGCESVTNGNYEDGMRYLKLELQENPKNGYAWAWILSIHMNKREFGEAIDAGQTALKLLPKKDSYYIGFVHKTLSRVYYNMDNKKTYLPVMILLKKKKVRKRKFLHLS